MTRQATARFTRGLSGWIRSALPGVVVDAPDEERGRRDRVVDAAIYLVAFAISAATLAGTWPMHPPWLRVVDVVVGIAALVALHWRRTHPAAATAPGWVRRRCSESECRDPHRERPRRAARARASAKCSRGWQH